MGSGCGYLGGVSVTLVSGLDVSQSVTIAVPLSLLCAQLHTIRRIAFIYPVQKADEYAKTCNTKGIMFMAVWWPQIFKFFLFGIPMFFGLYFGAEAIGNFMNGLPVWITNALSATGKMLPALGFAMTVNVIGRPQFPALSSWAVFFLAQYSGSAHPAGIVRLFVAIHVLPDPPGFRKEEDAVDAGTQAAVDADEKGKRLLSKKTSTTWFSAGTSIAKFPTPSLVCNRWPSVLRLYRF